MSSKIYFLSGPVKFAKVFDFNRDKGKYAPKDGEYNISVGLSPKDFKAVKGWNRMYQGKVWDKLNKFYLPGDSKLTYVTFKRKHKHYKADGESLIHEWSGPPTVLDENGEFWQVAPGVGLIGNGSVCTVKLDVTTVGDKTFVRLDGVRVDEHVEYTSDDDKEREPPVEVNMTDGIPF